MLISAQQKWNIEFKKSYIIGDRWRDIDAAHAVNCASYFIDYHYKEQYPKPPYHRANSLLDAVMKIKNSE